MIASRDLAVSPSGMGVEQQAGRLGAAAPHPAAQLVQLRQAEALGMLDHHHRGRRHVDADLDHRRGDQDRQPAVGEGRHRRLAFRALQAAMQQPDLAGKTLAQQPEPLGRRWRGRLSSDSSISGQTQ
jgi:hypothetical protein